MKNHIFNQLWEDRYEDREVILSQYFSDDYLTNLLTKDEIIAVRDTIEAATRAESFNDFCLALRISADAISEEFEIPERDIEQWQEGVFPDYIRNMITYFIVTSNIEYGRSKTCQSCGEFFFSKESKEEFCEGCKKEIGVTLLELYLDLREESDE